MSAEESSLPPLTRRAALRGFAAASLATAALGAVFTGAESWVSHPSIAMLATRDSLIALLRTRDHQLVLVGGTPEEADRDNARRLLSIARRRVDVLLVSDTVDDRANWELLFRPRRAFALLPALAPDADSGGGASPVAFMFDQDCQVTIRHGFTLARPGIEVPWLVSVQRGRTHLGIAATLDAVQFQAMPAPFSVLAAPKGTIATVLESTGAIVLTSSDVAFAPRRDRSADAGRVMPIYPATPTVVELKTEGASIRTGMFG